MLLHSPDNATAGTISVAIIEPSQAKYNIQQMVVFFPFEYVTSVLDNGGHNCIILNANATLSFFKYYYKFEFLPNFGRKLNFTVLRTNYRGYFVKWT